MIFSKGGAIAPVSGFLALLCVLNACGQEPSGRQQPVSERDRPSERSQSQETDDNTQQSPSTLPSTPEAEASDHTRTEQAWFDAFNQRYRCSVCHASSFRFPSLSRNSDYAVRSVDSMENGSMPPGEEKVSANDLQIFKEQFIPK